MAFLMGQAGVANGDLPRLVRQIRTVYKTCKTYRDTGSQEIWILDKKGKKTLWGESRFSTAFLRPGQLRLEFDEPTPDRKGRVSSVLWTVKGASAPPNDPSEPTPYPVDIYIGLDGTLHPNNGFTAAIASFASLAFGIADRVPLMLLPIDGMPDYLAQKDLRRVAPERVDGRPCFVLSSKALGMRFWFDKASGLLVKLVETNDFGDGRTSIKTIRYSPKVDVPVLPSEFKGPAAPSRS